MIEYGQSNNFFRPLYSIPLRIDPQYTILLSTMKTNSKELNSCDPSNSAGATFYGALSKKKKVINYFAGP